MSGPTSSVSESQVGDASSPPRLGWGFSLWLVGVAGSLLGDAVLYFALGWVASARSGSLAGVVLTAVVIPRALLLLLGGAVADRRGARQVMLVGDAVMLVVTLMAAGVSRAQPLSVWLLIVIGLCVGTVNAFYLPASGAMPRLLVRDQAVPRALALRQVVGGVVVFAGAPLGGVMVAIGGLTLPLLFDAATFAVMLVVLCYVRVPQGSRETSTRGVLSEVGDGLRLVAKNPLLRATMILVGVAAGFLLPVMSLVVPLVAHAVRWNAQSAGLVVGTFSAASVVVALGALARGVSARAGLFGALGLLVAGVGVAMVAVTTWLPLAVAGGAVTGLGTGLFGTHIGPLVLRSAPTGFTSRVQSIGVLVQTVPLLVTNNALGWWSDHGGARQAALICAGVTLAAGAYGCLSPTLRRAVFT
jgi:hypothetical protein